MGCSKDEGKTNGSLNGGHPFGCFGHSWGSISVTIEAISMRAILLLFLGLVHLFARDAETTGTVEPNLVEFKIPLEQPASATWNWNRPETPGNDGEYIWQVAVPSGSGRYKSPGSKPARGPLQALFKAGQASVFKERRPGSGRFASKRKGQSVGGKRENRVPHH